MKKRGMPDYARHLHEKVVNALETKFAVLTAWSKKDGPPKSYAFPQTMQALWSWSDQELGVESVSSSVMRARGRHQDSREKIVGIWKIALSKHLATDKKKDVTARISDLQRHLQSLTNLTAKQQYQLMEAKREKLRDEHTIYLRNEEISRLKKQLSTLRVLDPLAAKQR